MTSAGDRIETLIRERIERQRYSRSSGRAAGDLQFTPLRLSPSVEAAAGDYLRQSWALAELLRYYDRQFVQHAYLVVLKRDADVQGLTDRLQKLQRGEISRLEVLFRLRYGPEGREHKTRIRGLLRAFLLERICRIPVLGVIPRYLLALLRLPRLHRDIEELRGLIAMQKNAAEDRQSALVDFQNREFDRIITRLQK